MTISTAIQEIQRRVDAATPGPWHVKSDNIFEHYVEAEHKTGCDDEDNAYYTVCYTPGEHGGYSCSWGAEKNATLIANAPTDLTKLVKALEVAVDKLDFYAKNKGLRIDHRTNNFISSDCDDHLDFHGCSARQALTEIEKIMDEK